MSDFAPEFILHTHTTGQCPEIRLRYKIKNKAAIAPLCKSYVKLIATLFFIPY